LEEIKSKLHATHSHLGEKVTALQLIEIIYKLFCNKNASPLDRDVVVETK
jgi:hypothetical protein